MIIDLENAWRPKDAAAVETLPAGRYLSAGENNRCSADGVPGFLRREGNYLVCETRQPGPTRADSAPSRTNMSAADGEKLKHEAWLESVNFVSNQWRS
jgi:hypothetical protein